MTTALRKSTGILGSIDRLIRKLLSGSKENERGSRRPSLPQRPINGGNRVNGVVHRRSEAWRDGIGPGYVTGVTQSVLDLMSEKSER